MSPEDQRLHGLLRAWRGAEPTADFEAAVWRRLREADLPAARRAGLAGRQPLRFSPGRAWANALAAAAGVMVGVGLAFSAAAPQSGRHGDEPLLHARTLAGAYLALVAGGGR